MKTLLRRSGAGEHRIAIEGTDLGAEERIALEHVVGDIIGVRPHSDFGVIVQVGD